MQHATRPEDGRERFALLLGEIAEAKPTRYGHRFLIKHLKEYAFWVAESVWLSFVRRFEREAAALSPAAEDVLVLGMLILSSARKVGHFNVVGGSLMRVTPQFIPIHSRYEALVAGALVEENRAFIKPLRYDARESEVFPDFLLLDAGDRPLPMEIYGFTGSETYERRKLEKIAAYRSGGQPFWQWDIAASGGNPGAWPAFPPRKDGIRCFDPSERSLKLTRDGVTVG
jgi:hypothetical protein